MELNEALAFIHATDWKGSRLGLERMRELMHRLGNPQDSLKFIHVAGTNGKGSTSTMLASILTAAGYKTGLYTSPHLVRVNERFRINGADIPDAALCRAAEAVKEAAGGMSDAPTEFEILTAMGFRHFAAEKCDAVVLEVGLGGRLDATNVIPSPQAAVITNIGLEHTAILGHTLPEIAREKAGIIKPGCDAVIYREKPSVEAVFEERCEKLGVPLHKADFDSLQLLSHSLEGQVFDWEDFKGLQLPLLGEHQLHNAAVALTTARVLQKRGWRITDENIREGIETVRWPGRFELMRREPMFIIDGGHNPQCIEALVKNIEDYLPGRELTVLTGVLGDKDFHCMYRDVARYAKEFITITPANPRALPADKLAEYLRQFGRPVTACQSAEEGVRLAVEHAGRDGIVLCYGSLYMIGDIDAALGKL